MKKLMMMAVILLAGVGSVMAQSDYKRGIFNHVGLNVGAGTEGISVGLAAPVTSFLEVEAGVNVMPSFKLSGDLDVDYDSSSLPQVSGVSYPNPATIHVDGDFSRTTFNVKANLYPFGGGSKFFIAAGLSIGGEKIAEVTGSCDELREISHRLPYSGYEGSVPFRYLCWLMPTWVVINWNSMRTIMFRAISVAKNVVHTSV